MSPMVLEVEIPGRVADRLLTCPVLAVVGPDTQRALEHGIWVPRGVGRVLRTAFTPETAGELHGFIGSVLAEDFGMLDGWTMNERVAWSRVQRRISETTNHYHEARIAFETSRAAFVANKAAFRARFVDGAP